MMKFSEEKLLEEFKDQNVIEVKRIMKKVDGVLCPQPLLILSFNLLKLPETVTAAWHYFKVRTYIPSPRRCFHCQKFGHVTTSCRRKAKNEAEVCVRCSQDFHGECTNILKCANCEEEHQASDRKCEKYLFEKEVMTIKTVEKISFSEAKKKISSNIGPFRTSFAATVKNGKSKSSINTLNQQNSSNNSNKRSRSNDCITLPSTKIQNMRISPDTQLNSQEGHSSSSNIDGPSVSPSLTTSQEEPSCSFTTGGPQAGSPSVTLQEGPCSSITLKPLACSSTITVQERPSCFSNVGGPLVNIPTTPQEEEIQKSSITNNCLVDQSSEISISKSPPKILHVDAHGGACVQQGRAELWQWGRSYPPR